MGSIIEETEDDRDYDVEDTVFVAVGKNVEKSKATLFWALRSFAGKKICLLHVHQTTHVLPLTQLCFTCDSSKFGYIWTYENREGRNDRMEADHAFPLLLMDSAIGSNKPGHLGTESVGHSMRSSDATDEADELEGIFASFSSQCSMHSSYFSDRVVDTFETTPFLTDEVENILVQATGNSSHRPEQAIMDTKDSKKQVFEEAAKRQKDEDDAMEAKCKATFSLL
ncbi:U-box domain-containing protein 32 isoform X4 [Tripterygium wilfordii]|uniref:U-box domain-containing protein 32 isoform X4 n=1 Tax=Tripterygium wilfordii TaxID=458696 RepID=A0A7J7CB86_TRIWF|nr:U-box domain-containing protein 32 isoform X4 [Tripterygium wilfordii]